MAESGSTAVTEGAVIDAALGSDLARAALALARRFSAGATMWCVAPRQSAHARHVAVEFVHPVIVGKRALPAAALCDPVPATALRVNARAGDVVVAIGPAGDADVGDVVRRAPAWGLLSIWVGTGARPAAGAADHVLWLDDGPGRAAVDGRVVLLYHVLWELTHVCLEHPGLLAAETADECDATGHCITCGDEGRLGEVVGMLDDGATASVRLPDGIEAVDATLVGTLGSGALVLVHAGTAIAVVDGSAE
jgi:hypothetical protein